MLDALKTAPCRVVDVMRAVRIGLIVAKGIKMLKILIADDHLIYRETLKMMLQPYGQCVAVEDGVQAVQAFRDALNTDKPFQLVLLDLQMPNMSGQEALLQIRQLEKRKHGTTLSGQVYAVVFIQTSVEEPEELVAAYEKGRCNGYLLKPVDQDELLARLRKHNLI